MAGGSGSRLGFEHPKGIFLCYTGLYNIGMPSNRSIFEYHSERILKVQNLGKFISTFN